MSKKSKGPLLIIVLALASTFVTKGFQEFANLLSSLSQGITFSFVMLARFIYELEGTNILASVVVGVVSIILVNRILKELDIGGSRDSKLFRTVLTLVISSILTALTGWLFNPILEWLIYSNN